MPPELLARCAQNSLFPANAVPMARTIVANNLLGPWGDSLHTQTSESPYAPESCSKLALGGRLSESGCDRTDWCSVPHMWCHIRECDPPESGNAELSATTFLLKGWAPTQPLLQSVQLGLNGLALLLRALQRQACPHVGHVRRATPFEPEAPRCFWRLWCFNQRSRQVEVIEATSLCIHRRGKQLCRRSKVFVKGRARHRLTTTTLQRAQSCTFEYDGCNLKKHGLAGWLRLVRSTCNTHQIRRDPMTPKRKSCHRDASQFEGEHVSTTGPIDGTPGRLCF